VPPPQERPLPQYSVNGEQAYDLVLIYDLKISR
jgi:hypothetical protein